MNQPDNRLQPCALKANEGWVYPCGIEHGYTMRSDSPVRLIAVTAPVKDGSSGGWDGFIADMESRQ